MIFDKERFKKQKNKMKEFYFGIKKIYCPCLKNYVFFNANGFHHLMYKVSGRERNIKEQKYKLNLLPLVIPVIKKAEKVYSYERKSFITIRRKKGYGRKKSAEYWVLMEIVGKEEVKTKVVLRKVGTGILTFWSIMRIR